MLTTSSRFVSQLTSFLRRLSAAGVLFSLEFLKRSLNLPAPSSEYSTDFIKRGRKSGIFWRFKRVCFPKYEQEDFDSINFSYGKTHPRMFFRRGKECGRRDCFNHINEKTVSLL